MKKVLSVVLFVCLLLTTVVCYGALNTVLLSDNAGGGKVVKRTTINTSAAIVNRGSPRTCSHSFTSQIPSSTYLKSSATCTRRAVYYKCCSKCGAKGTATFEHGSLSQHVYQQVANSNYLKSSATCQSPAIYYMSCKNCRKKALAKTFKYGNPRQHNFSERNTSDRYLKSAATCSRKAVYYMSCSMCGTAGTRTFDFGNVASHDYSAMKMDRQYLVTQATCTSNGVYYYSCKYCGRKGTETFLGPKAEHKGTVVGYSSVNDKTHNAMIRCTTCKKVVSQSEAHSFENGYKKSTIGYHKKEIKCTKCSYRATLSERCQYSVKYTYIDDSKHFEEKTCGLCGSVVKTAKAHNRSTSDGRCACESRPVVLYLAGDNDQNPLLMQEGIRGEFSGEMIDAPKYRDQDPNRKDLNDKIENANEYVSTNTDERVAVVAYSHGGEVARGLDYENVSTLIIVDGCVFMPGTGNNANNANQWKDFLLEVAVSGTDVCLYASNQPQKDGSRDDNSKSKGAAAITRDVQDLITDNAGSEITIGGETYRIEEVNSNGGTYAIIDQNGQQVGGTITIGDAGETHGQAVVEASDNIKEVLESS
jgi:hypothetical protein